MSTITQTEQTVPTGTWTLDRTHSSVAYSVRHSGVSLFKGGLTDFEAALDDGRLYGSADVASITVQDENLEGHLLSPDFFDAERFPRVSFASAGIRRDGDEIVVDGELEIRGANSGPSHSRSARRPCGRPGRRQDRPSPGDRDRPDLPPSG